MRVAETKGLPFRCRQPLRFPSRLEDGEGRVWKIPLLTLHKKVDLNDLDQSRDLVFALFYLRNGLFGKVKIIPAEGVRLVLLSSLHPHPTGEYSQHVI